MRTIMAILLLALPAAAQTRKTLPEPAPKRITIDDPDEIDGHRPMGDGELVSARKKVILPSLIKIRENFWPEMHQRASDL